jgi:hypothetical protein
MKLHVNLLRFNRQKEEMLRKDQNQNKSEGVLRRVGEGRVRKGFSYAQAVADGSKNQAGLRSEREKAYDHSYHRSFKAKQEYVDRAQKCYVGRVKGSLNPFAV